MTDALLWHRIQFAFTITYHYLFPQLTMGLALLIVVFKSLALWLRDESYNEVARFWARIFALNFAMGVVTGIPMEFQFGTNWSTFSRFSGEVVGQALAMEGFSRSSSSRRFWGCSSSARSGSARGGIWRRPSPWRWARGSRATSSSSPTPSCSTRSATGWARTGCCISRVSGRTSSTPGRSGNTPTTCWPRSSRRRSSWPPWGLTGRSWASTPGTPGSACAWGSSRGWSPASWSRSRPVTAPARWWRSTSRSRSPRWRGCSKGDRTPSSPSSDSPTSPPASWRTRSSCPGSSASCATGRSAARSTG